MILKAFFVKITHLICSKDKKKLMWLPLIYPWVKCTSNTDGAANDGPASCGGIFRDYQTIFFGCFASNICILYALNAGIMRVILAIELAHKKDWIYICDKLLVLNIPGVCLFC